MHLCVEIKDEYLWIFSYLSVRKTLWTGPCLVPGPKPPTRSPCSFNLSTCPAGIMHLANQPSSETYWISYILSTSQVQKHTGYPTFCQPAKFRNIQDILHSAKQPSSETYWISCIQPTSQVQKHTGYPTFCQPAKFRNILDILHSVNQLSSEAYWTSMATICFNILSLL